VRACQSKYLKNDLYHAGGALGGELGKAYSLTCLFSCFSSGVLTCSVCVRRAVWVVAFVRVWCFSVSPSCALLCLQLSEEGEEQNRVREIGCACELLLLLHCCSWTISSPRLVVFFFKRNKQAVTLSPLDTSGKQAGRARLGAEWVAPREFGVTRHETGPRACVLCVFMCVINVMAWLRVECANEWLLFLSWWCVYYVLLALLCVCVRARVCVC